MLLGRRKLAFLFFSVVLPTLVGYGQNTDRYVIALNGQNTKTSVEVSDNNISIDYSIDSIELHFLNNDFGGFFRIFIPEHIHTVTPGEPELPVYNNLIVVPNGGNYKIKISEVVSESVTLSEHSINSLLYPAQEGETKNPENESPAFVIDKELYGTDQFFGIDTVLVSSIGVSRGNKLATLTISPIKYNPQKNILEIITSMKIDISFIDDGLQAEVPVNMGRVSRQMITDLTLNYNSNEVIPRFREEPVKMIILTDSTFVNSLVPYINWKAQKGFETILVYVGKELESYNYSKLRDTLKNIYDYHNSLGTPPDYLLIVGDVSIIPFYSGASYITDLYYGEMDGNSDYIPEMLIGRLPAKDSLDVKNITSKIIQYEKYDFGAENNFASKALMFAGVDATYYKIMNGHIRYGLENYLLPENNISERHFYYPTVNKDSIINIINSGVSFINYTGHGSSTALLNINFITSDINKLNNTGKYPLMISNACRTSNFTVNSLGNTLVAAKDKGMIGYIGSSQDTYWNEDYYWAVGVGVPGDYPTYETTGLGALDRLFHTHREKPSDWHRSLGEIVFAGNMAVSSSTSSRKKMYWEIYNVVGDPSLIPFIGTPEPLSISVPDTLPNNIASLSIKAEPFCYAAISRRDTLLMASYFGPDGIVSFDLGGISNDSVLLVVTGQNRIPYIKNIYISDISGEFVTLSSYSVKDDNGNNNGIAEYGENINIDLVLDNYGASMANNIYVTISTPSKWFKMDIDTVIVGSLDGHTTIDITDQFSLKVADSIPVIQSVVLDVTIKGDFEERHYGINIVAHAPSLSINQINFDDTELGNGNLIPDSGESFQIIFNIANTGSVGATTNLHLTTDNLYLDIEETGAFFLPPKSSVDIPITINQIENLAIGTDLFFRVEATSGVYSGSETYIIRIGGTTESFESGTMDYFPWFNRSASPWTITPTTHYSGQFAAKSGIISHSQKTTLYLNSYYPRKDTISFYYKVSSEKNYDFLVFNLNGVTKLKVSGEIDWKKISVEIPEGYNTLEWLYVKDKSVSVSEDCAYIDLIGFSNYENIGFIENDIKLSSVVSPAKEGALGIEELTVNLCNLGIDTIKGFNLAFKVNDNSPIIQFFNDTIYSLGDTVTVTFTQKINFSGAEKYMIEVYNLDNDDYRYNDTIKMLFFAKDIEVVNFISPTAKDIRGIEDVTVGLYNQGIDTINGINLSYRINKGPIITQFFNESIYPYGDTLKVTFSEKADLSGIGSYYLEVFNMDSDYFRDNDTISVNIENLGYDMELVSIVAPIQKESVGRESVSIKLINKGPEKLGSITLGYMINGDLPYYEDFDLLLLPGTDSVQVTFNQKANLSIYGGYEITVFNHTSNDIYQLNDTLRVTIVNDDPSTKYEGNKAIDKIKIYPNPFITTFTLSFESKCEGNLSLTLFELTGRKVKTFVTEATLGENEISFEAGNLTKGYYLVRIEIDGESYSERIIKL